MRMKDGYWPVDCLDSSTSVEISLFWMLYIKIFIWFKIILSLTWYIVSFGNAKTILKFKLDMKFVSRTQQMCCVWRRFYLRFCGTLYLYIYDVLMPIYVDAWRPCLSWALWCCRKLFWNCYFVVSMEVMSFCFFHIHF